MFAIPSMFVRIPAASNPEKMFEAMLPACHMAILIGASSLVYHDELIKLTIGKKGPSASPTRNRQTMNDQPLFMRAMHAVMTDHTITWTGIWICGLPRARYTVAGSCEII